MNNGNIEAAARLLPHGFCARLNKSGSKLPHSEGFASQKYAVIAERMTLPEFL